VLDRGAERRQWAAMVRARQAGAVDQLVAAARDADGAVTRCLHWLGVLRHVERLVRHAGGPRPSEEVARHRAGLEAAADEAWSHVAAAGMAVIAQARSRLGLRVAVIGKGGTGKSFVSATLARLLARRGRPVLAVDFDTNPGLAFSLGVPPTLGVLPDDALMQHPGAAYGWGLGDGLAPAAIVDRHAVAAPDGVRLVTVGKIGGADKDAARKTIAAVRELAGAFGEPDWDVVGDLEAGPTTPFERYHAFADRALVVVSPTWVSAMTARRLLPMVDDVEALVVGNQFRDEPDHAGLEPLGRIPWDADVAEAERRGRSPLDHCPDSPAVAAVARLADALTRQEVMR
jgi:CO dehydrogenase maturation factor